MNILVELINLDRMSDRPFVLQGISGKNYGTALYDRAKGGHVITLPLEDLKNWGADIVRGGDRPLSKWRVYDVTVEGDEGSEIQLAEALEVAQADSAALRGEVETLKANVTELLNELIATREQRDAAIRAIGAPPAAPSPEPIPAAPDKVSSEQSGQGAAEQKKPPIESEDKSLVEEEEIPQSDPAVIHTRESLEAIGKFRSVRSIAMKAGVPGAESINNVADLINAILAHQASQANG